MVPANDFSFSIHICTYIYMYIYIYIFFAFDFLVYPTPCFMPNIDYFPGFVGYGSVFAKLQVASASNCMIRNNRIGKYPGR